MYLIVFIHELGHILISLIFKWNIKKINIYPFGGYTVFDEAINKPFIEEFLVFLGGILFQVILFLFFTLIFDKYAYTYQIFSSYNKTILIFNMIPIIPLDGSKVLNILLNKLFPFKLSHLISIYISYTFIIILLLKSINEINMILILAVITFILRKEHKNHIYIFNSFLLERYLKDLRFKKVNIINGENIKKMKKYLKNIFINNGIYVSEKEMLRNRFQNH